MQEWAAAPLALVPGLALAFLVHENAHSIAAWRLGAPGASSAARLSANPLRFIDLFGLAMAFFLALGWARPLDLDPGRLKRPSRDSSIVALAGPVANLAAGMLLIALARVANAQGGFLEVLEAGARINASFFFFNLLPLPPLDGSLILYMAIPERFVDARALYLRSGGALLMALLLIEALSPGFLPVARMVGNFIALVS